MNYSELNIEGYRLKVFSINKLLVGIPVDVGPRILYLAPIDNPGFNLFAVLPDIAVETPEGVWHIHGGHRLWTAPEAIPRTYSLDNRPVKLEVSGNRITVTGNPEYANNVLKKIHIEPGSEERSVRVIHEVVNIGRWPIEFACWAITVMRKHGFAIIPIKPKSIDPYGLLPDRYVVIWPYTTLRDQRLHLLDTYIVVEQNPEVKKALKIGTRANPTWIAYWVNGYLFAKKIDEEKAAYPDHGSTVEVYVNDRFLELETLGPLRKVEPGNSNIHVETWKVLKMEDLEISEEDLNKKLVKIMH